MKSLIDRRKIFTLLFSGMGGFVLPSRLAFSGEQEPYKRMFDDPMQFSGPDDDATRNEYLIGVYSPETGEQSLLPGARMAIDEINQSEILDKPIRLIQRWADDPWGAGSQQLIKMAYEDNVIAIIGGPDSASTHVAQQIALKAHVPLLAPTATDSTLTEIRVPWIFRLPPNDDALSSKLVSCEILHSGARIGLIYAGVHDARMAATAFRKSLQKYDVAPLFELIVPDETGAIEKAVERAVAFLPEKIWVWFHQYDIKLFLARMQNKQCKQILTQWKTDDSREWRRTASTAITYAAPFQWKDDGMFPSYRDAYCYDAVRIIAEAIRNGGVTRKRLRDAMANLSGFEGVAGVYQWDNGGGNLTKPVVLRY